MYKKLTIEEIDGIAKKRGGKCLSKRYINSRTKLQWQCNEGHIWNALSNNVRQGCWCPFCANRVKLTIDEMNSIAQSRGGKCLSKEYINSSIKLQWQCLNKHTWVATPNNIKKGTWCPICAINSQRDTIKKMKEIAKLKNGECLSKKYINNSTKLVWRCKVGHIWEAKPNVIKQGHWCPYCSNTAKLTLEEMRELALSRGGWCLSLEYINNRDKLWWQCGEGHIWDATAGPIKNSNSWCPHCANRALLSIDEMRKLAEKRNGKCLSTEYINVHTKLRWRCEKNHEWSATPKDVKSGKWCSACHFESIRGNGHPRWNGGRFPHYGAGWVRANKNVLKRAVGRSEVSGEAGKLDVHHIIPCRNFVDRFVDLCLKPYIPDVNRVAFKVLPYDLIPQVLYDEMNGIENLVALLSSEHQVFEGMPLGFFDAIRGVKQNRKI